MADRSTGSTVSAAVGHTEVGRLLAEAEAAIAARDWAAATTLLTIVLRHEPGHAEATARLALVRSHTSRTSAPVRGATAGELNLSRGALVGLAILIVVCAAAAMALGVWAGS